MPERSSHLMALVDLETMEVIENLKDEDLIHRKVSSKRDAP